MKTLPADTPVKLVIEATIYQSDVQYIRDILDGVRAWAEITDAKMTFPEEVELDVTNWG